MTKCVDCLYFCISVFRYFGISVYQFFDGDLLFEEIFRGGGDLFCFFSDCGGHWLEIAHSFILLSTNKGRDSSGVERMTSNHKAAGSNPARGFSAQYLGGLVVINFIDAKIKI